MKCAYNKKASIHIDVDGTLKVTLKAIEAGGNEAVVKDWHAVDDLEVSISSRKVSGKSPLAYTIDENNHSLLSIGGAEGVVRAGESQIVIVGRLGANCFTSTYFVQCDASGDNEVTDNLVLEVTCVPEDGGVQTFGGQAGKITLGEHLSMSGKQLQVEYPQPYIHHDIVADMEGEGVTDLATALSAMNGKTVAEVFGTEVTIADINAEFDSAKSLIVLDGSNGYVFNRLSVDYDEENGDTNTFLYYDGTTAHTVAVAPTGVTAS